jgi:hypothetical protein
MVPHEFNKRGKTKELKPPSEMKAVTGCPEGSKVVLSGTVDT